MMFLTQLIFAAQTSTATAATVNKLVVIAENVNVDVKLSSDGQYSYDYDNSKFTVTTETNGGVFKINVKAKKKDVKGWDNRVKIYIPDQAYKHIKCISKKAGVGLQAANSNITVKNKQGAVSVKLPSGYNKTLNYIGSFGSGSLDINKNKDFNINTKISCCAFSVPGEWPAYSNSSANYNYKSGEGTAKINIDITNCSFSFVK